MSPSVQIVVTLILCVGFLSEGYIVGRNSREPWALLQSGNTVISGQCHTISHDADKPWIFKCDMNK